MGRHVREPAASSLKGLQGKVAVVTGGASGIGLATAVAFAERGVSVAIADISVEAGGAAEQRITAMGGVALFVAADVSDEEAIAALMHEVAGNFGRIDILVDCAVAPVGRSVEEATPEDWRRAFETNVFGYALCASMRWSCGSADMSVSRPR